jgi:hypothetical protein
MRRALDTFDAALRKVQPVVKQVERVAPLIGASRPLALALSAVGILADLRRVNEVKPARPVCLEEDGEAINALCRAAADAGVGRVLSVDNIGHAIREHDGCEWGAGNYWRHGPFGNAAVLPRVTWEHLGTAIAAGVAMMGFDRRVELRRDELTTAAPSAIAHQVAAEAKALRDAGEPVGVLLHGPPGTGKSVIARWVARALGGYSLRARLGDVSPSALLGLVRLLEPRAVILDDADRGETKHALDLAEQLSARTVLLVTANDCGQMDRALLRARRLGLHYLVAGVDAEVLEQVLAGLEVPAAVRDELARSTVADVRDYAGHVRALGSARALELLRARRAS